jgi:hypothetical protein
MTSVPREGAWIGPFYRLMLLYNNVARMQQYYGTNELAVFCHRSLRKKG